MARKIPGIVFMAAAVAALLIFSGCPKKDEIPPAKTALSPGESGAPSAPAASQAPGAAQARAAETAKPPAGSAPVNEEDLSASERAAKAAAATAMGGSDGQDGLTAERMSGAEASAGAAGLTGQARQDLESLVVHFDFDRAELRPDALPILDKAAKLLLADKPVRIVLEGHCDERGTPEYNLALGQRRAEAVKQYLVDKGVAAKTLDTVSMGSEQPVDPAHNEAAWAKNRRVIFIAK